MSKKQGSQVVTWDFTFFPHQDHEKIIKQLTELCKAWDFQQEMCPTTSKLHFQGRFKLKVKERLATLSKKLAGYSLSITSTENRDNVYYVTKQETRVAGPWSSEDEIIFVPAQFQNKVWRPWQQKVIDSKLVFDNRHINVIVDSIGNIGNGGGNIGKSTIVGYLDATRYAVKIPFIKDYKDLMRVAYNSPKLGMYLVDIPRGLKSESVDQLYAGLEELKNGYVYEDRYTFKRQWINSPVIWVFTNVVPNSDLLSRDRWVYYRVVDNDLEIFDPTKINTADFEVEHQH